MDSSITPATLRDLTRATVRARIAGVAIDLFAEHGFDNVTVEQIALAAGASPRSFHRYFPAKEDAVIGNTAPLGAFVSEQFAGRPRDESVWESLRIAFEALIETSDDAARDKRTLRVLMSTPGLRARNLEKHLLWATMLTPLVRDRLDGDDADLRADTVVQASLVCFDLALTVWARDDAPRPATEYLRRTFGTLEPTRPPRRV